jgi:RNA polymerase sigma-70 factor, ECF subfamily
MSSRVYREAVPHGHVGGAPSDAELMRDLANGRQEALGPLYGRYGRLVFSLARQSLDQATAEELVQEVFLTIWRGADGFDASQGDFRPWLLRLTHWKILNELRRRRRRPAEQPGGSDDADATLEQLADAQPGPEERAWQNQRVQQVRAALEALPPKQRHALALAYLDDLTHEQVAKALDVPLGTAKTRIRSGLQLLRTQLAPVAASLLGLALVVVGVRYAQEQQKQLADERALDLVTTSELVPLRLTPASADVPVGAHANYRGRAGVDVAVLTAELLPAPPAGQSYQAWVRHGDRWTALGTLEPRPDGSARVIAENPDLATPPEAVEITLERSPSGPAPSGPVVLVWPNS